MWFSRPFQILRGEKWNWNISCWVICLWFIADVLFAQGPEVVFKVALCLLQKHECNIIECDSFETVVDYLKTTMPNLTVTQMEQTISQVGKVTVILHYFQYVSDEKNDPWLVISAYPNRLWKWTFPNRFMRMKLSTKCSWKCQRLWPYLKTLTALRSWREPTLT